MVVAMSALTIADVEIACDATGITLVMHPAVRRAIRAYQESFYIGACSFLRGETDGLFFLPLTRGGLLPLRFSRRLSARGYPILRLDPVTQDGLARIKAAAMQLKSWPVS
jgi:hypothetical protein